MVTVGSSVAESCVSVDRHETQQAASVSIGGSGITLSLVSCKTARWTAFLTESEMGPQESGEVSDLTHFPTA